MFADPNGSISGPKPFYSKHDRTYLTFRATMAPPLRRLKLQPHSTVKALIFMLFDYTLSKIPQIAKYRKKGARTRPKTNLCQRWNGKKSYNYVWTPPHCALRMLLPQGCSPEYCYFDTWKSYFMFYGHITFLRVKHTSYNGKAEKIPWQVCIQQLQSTSAKNPSLWYALDTTSILHEQKQRSPQVLTLGLPIAFGKGM